MTGQPLTHHDILRLVEPFTRNGRQLDLAASDRIQRSLVFKPKYFSDPASATTIPTLTDTLALDCLADDRFVLKRSVTHPAGLLATLLIQGADTTSLLASVEAIDPQTLFRSGQGWHMACSYRLEPGHNTSRTADVTPAAHPSAQLLASAMLRVQGLTLQLKMPAVTGYPGDIDLTANAAIELPDDLLQVLGRDWTRLSKGAKGWRGTLQIRGKEPERSRLAEQQLEAAARHLAQTLSQPPAAFHRQQAGARWRVAARRSVPLLTLLALVLGALAVPYLGIEQDSVYWMLIFNAPPLLLLWGFSLREMPSFDLPRPPKRLKAPRWWPTPPDAPLANSPEAAPPGTAASSVTP